MHGQRAARSVGRRTRTTRSIIGRAAGIVGTDRVRKREKKERFLRLKTPRPSWFTLECGPIWHRPCGKNDENGPRFDRMERQSASIFQLIVPKESRHAESTGFTGQLE